MNQTAIRDMPVGYDSDVATQQGKLMRNLMRERGLRIKDLVNLTGWSRPTISRHLNGVRVPNFEQRQEYARHLGVPVGRVDSIWVDQAPVNEEDGARLVLHLRPHIYNFLRPVVEESDLTLEDAAELLIMEAAERRQQLGDKFDDLPVAGVVYSHVGIVGSRIEDEKTGETKPTRAKESRPTRGADAREP